MSASKPTILVTTAESRTGDAVVQELLAGRYEVGKVISLFPTALENPEEERLGAEEIFIDVPDAKFEDVQGVMMKGVDVAVIIPPAADEKMAVAHKFLTAAKSAGVENVVVLSCQACDNPNGGQRMNQFLEIERAAKGSGIRSVCIIRAPHYYQNLFLYTEQIKDAKFLGLPIDDRKFAPVDVRDIATAVSLIAAQGVPKYAERCFEITGPEALNGHDLVAKSGIPDLVFKPISVVDWREYIELKEEIDVSEIELLDEQFHLIRLGQLEYVTKEFQQITGVEPRKVQKWWDEVKDDIIPTEMEE